MRPRLLLTSLIVTLIFSQACAFAAGYPEDIVYPFLDMDEKSFIIDPYLDESYIEYLKTQEIYPVIGSDGVPLFYFSENSEAGCTGICEQVDIGDYTLTTRNAYVPEEALQAYESPLLVGNDGIESHIDNVNSIREVLSGDPIAIDEFEKMLLENNEDYLNRVYYENAYDDVFDYAIDELMNDPYAYDSIVRDMRMGDVEAAVKDYEKFMEDNYEFSESFDMSDLYSSLRNGNIGTKQYDELLRNVLERIAKNENIDIDLDDLSKFSDLIDSEELGKVMDKVEERMMDDPEMFDKIKELSEDMLKDPETMDMFRDAINEMIEKADWESIQKLMDIFNEMENKEKLLEMLMKGFSDHMREMTRNGKLDEIKSMVQDEKMLELMNQALETFSETFMDQIDEWLRQIPIEFAYVLALAVTITTLIILAKIKM